MKNVIRKSLSGLRAKWIAAGTIAVCAVSSLGAETLKPSVPAEGLSPEAPAHPGEGAGGGQASPAQRVHEFHIPAGALGDAVHAFEHEAHVHVSLPSQDVVGIPTKAVDGVLSTQEALTRLLDGTGLAGTFLSDHTVQLKLRSADQTVTVTADTLSTVKYTAPLRDLPQTVTVIPETVIQNTASTSLIEALRTVPGITFGAGEGGNPVGDRPYLRGVDSQSSTFVDNMRDIGSQSREVFDVQSVEIAKGPSGGFVGRGAGGGSININSKMANRDKFLSGSFSPGTAKFFRGTLDGNAKLAKGMYGRLNGMAQDSNVAGRDVIHANRYGVAPALQFDLNKRVRLFANYYDLRQNDMMDPGMPYNNPTDTGDALPTDGRQRIFQVGDGQPLVVNRKLFYGITSRDYRYEKAKTAFGRMEVDLWEGTMLRNSYRYGKSNQDYLYSMADDSQGNIYYGLIYRRALNRNTVVDTSIDQTDLAGSVKTGPIKHTYATGFEFARERSWNGSNTPTVPVYAEANVVDSTGPKLRSASRCPLGAGAAGGYFCTSLFNPTYRDPWLNVQSLGVTSTTDATPKTYTNTINKTTTPTRQRTITSSLYAFDTMQLLPQLMATVGIRYDHYKSNYRNPVTCIPAPNAPCSFDVTQNLANYQGALTYKPKRAISIYGSVASSTTPPGNSLSQGSDPSSLNSLQNIALPPEKNRTEEVGVKWELFRGRAMATGAWFQADTENVRITNALGFIDYAGKRRNRGVDFGLTGYLTSKWQVFGGYTYMNAILVEAGGSGAAAGLLNGRRFPNTPQNSFAFTSYYQATKKLNVGGGVYATGKVFGNDSPTAPKWVPAYARVDMFGSYSFNKHLQLSANLQNVGDKTYFLQAYTTHFAQLAPGRQGRITLNFLF